MVSSGAAWTTRPLLRWFVRSSAVLVGLACLVGVVAWWVGGLYVLGGEDESSLREAVPSAIAAVLAGLLTSEIVLRAFDLPGRDFEHRYRVVGSHLDLSAGRAPFRDPASSFGTSENDPSTTLGE